MPLAVRSLQPEIISFKKNMFEAHAINMKTYHQLCRYRTILDDYRQTFSYIFFKPTDKVDQCTQPWASIWLTTLNRWSYSAVTDISEKNIYIPIYLQCDFGFVVVYYLTGADTALEWCCNFRSIRTKYGKLTSILHLTIQAHLGRNIFPQYDNRSSGVCRESPT